jgi:hypothetical protein
VKHIRPYNEKFLIFFNSDGDSVIREMLSNKDDIQFVRESGYGYSFRFRGKSYHSSIEEIMFARYYFYIEDKETECSYYLGRKLYNYLDKKATKIPRSR